MSTAAGSIPSSAQAAAAQSSSVLMSLRSGRRRAGQPGPPRCRQVSGSIAVEPRRPAPARPARRAGLRAGAAGSAASWPQGRQQPAQRTALVHRRRGAQSRGRPRADQPLRPPAPCRTHAAPVGAGTAASGSASAGACAAASSRAICAASRNGRSAASSTSHGAAASASPRRSAGTGPPPGGSSRTTAAPSPASAPAHGTRRGGPTTISRLVPARSRGAGHRDQHRRTADGQRGLVAPPRRAPRRQPG